MMDTAALKMWATGRIPSARLAHCSRVAQLAQWLAQRYDVDPDKARLAGFLHDCARDESPARLLELAGLWRIPVTEVEARAPILLHAPVGAELVRRECGVEDIQILDAIRFHTTGRSGMSPLEKIVFVADYAEPARDFPGVERVRAAMFECLDTAVRFALDQSLRYLLERGYLVHPNMVAARNALYM